MEVGGREARRNAFQKIQLSGRHTQSGHGVPVALAQQEERAEIVGERAQKEAYVHFLGNQFPSEEGRAHAVCPGQGIKEA